MKMIFLSIFIGIFSYIQASNIIGKVELFKGNVKIKHQNSIKKTRVTSGLDINTGDLITSSKNASAELKLIDGSLITLDQSSTISFNSLSNVKQVEGKILYKITSRDAKNSLKVKTPFAIIGIKGTTFIVNATSKPSISLQEGLLGIKSINKEFKLYRKKLQEEFDAFKHEGDKHIQAQKDAFQAYKKDQNNYAKVKIVKEFDLKSGHKVSFDAQTVKEDSFSKTDSSEFDYFQQLIQDMK